MARRLALSWLLVLCQGCTVHEAIDLRPYLEKQSFPVTQGAVPTGATTVGLVVVQDSGFYVFGFVPIVSIRLEACVDTLVREAKNFGGDGVAEVQMVYEPASFLTLSSLIIPDWFAHVRMSGSAWRRSPN
jgi:hypothetical protein